MKPVKRKAKPLVKYIPSTILSMGYYDIDYSIKLSDEDIEKYKIENIEDLKTYEDISFIVENKYLWSKISLETENKMINILLYINKISTESNKSYIEYIPYETPIYYNESFKTMIKTVNDLNFLFINEYSINKDSKKYFKLKIIYKEQETTINFNQVEKEKNNKENENEIKVGENNNSNNNEDKAKEEAKNVNNENEEKNENRKENKKSDNFNYLNNKNNIFNKIKLDCETYNYFLLSIENTLEITPYEDFIEFLIHLKINLNAHIAIEYGDVSEFFNDKESMTLLNKIYLLTDIFLFDEKDAINNFKKHYEFFTKEKDIKKYNFNENKLQINVEIEENNKSVSSSHTSKKRINKKSNNNNNSNIIVKKNKDKNMSEKDLYDYFKHTIACNGALSILNNKLAIFLDNYFSKVTFIEVPMNIKATVLSYEIKPYPKLSHTTVDIVEFYKGKLRLHKNFFKSIFYAGILNKIFIAKRKAIGLEILYPAYLTGHEILKRMLSLKASEMKFPDKAKFYIVRLDNNEINEYVKREYYNKKEQKFVLDCTNLEKSKLKYYVPLLDYNLNEFFGNKLITKQLVNKGFIDSKGFLKYDPIYMKEMGIQKKLIKRNSNSVNHLENIINNNSNGNNKVLENQPTIKIKLPAITYRIKK